MSNGNGFDPNNVNDWRAVLHKAAAIQSNDPHYAEAQEWKAKALQNIGDLESRMGAGEKRDAQDLGGGAAFGLGAARAMSFGLGDLPFLHTDTERQAIATTGSEHPGSTAAGEFAGGAVPYLLTGGSALLPRTLIGAAQGAGLTHGDIGDRAKGAILGAAISRYAPQVAKVAGTAGRGALGVLGRLAGRVGAEAPAAAGEAASLAGAAEAPAARLRGEFPTSEPTVSPAPARPPVSPDIRRAVADYRAGKISGEDLRTAMDFASGHVAPDPIEEFGREGMIVGERPVSAGPKPISEGPPGSSVHPERGASVIPEPPHYTPAVQGARRAAAQAQAGGLDPKEAARAAFNLRQAAEEMPVGGAPTPGPAGPNPALPTGKGQTLPYYPRGGAAPSPTTTAGSVLGPQLQASVRADQLLKGPPTQAARQEVFTLLKDLGPAASRFLQTHLTPAWKAVLQP